MTKNILIIGGTSGLGLELAKLHQAMGHSIYITGRKNPNEKNLNFLEFSIDSNIKKLKESIDKLLAQLSEVHTLIYAAGYYQEGRIDQLSEDEILQMINVAFIAPILLVKRLKNNPGKPLKVILITSSSQYTPREKEPVYTSVKAGLGMFGNSLGLDPELGKVLVIAPSGMQTPFWNGEKDTSTMLDPKWVAEEVTKLSSGAFKYKYARILRESRSVEIVELREK